MNRTILLKQLKQIGLSTNEANLYIAAVQKNIFTPAEIASIANMPRTTCYTVIESLLKKSFIARVPDRGSLRFIVVDPSVILEKKREEMREFEISMKYMSSIKDSMSEKDIPKIKLYKGVDGVKQIHYEILHDKPDTLSSIADPEFISQNISVDFRELWVQKRIATKINVRSLRPTLLDTNGEVIMPHYQKNREVRFWPEDLKLGSMLFVWGNKVGFISTKKEGISFVVTSQEFSSVLKQCFDYIWKNGKKYANF